MARKINAVSPNESRLNGYFADPERRNTSNFRGISYEDERRAHANEIYESGTKWVNEQLQSGGGSGGGGGAQPDWNAAEGEPGHILNRPCWKDRSVVLLPPTDITGTAEGVAPIPFTEGLVVEAGRTYEVSLAAGGMSNTVSVEAFLYEQDGMEMGAILPIDDTMQIAVVLPELGAQEGISGVVMGIPEGATYTIGIAAPGDVKTLDLDMIPEPPFFDISSIGTITKNGVRGNIDRGIYKALGKGP